MLNLNVNIYCWWRDTLLQSRNYDVIQVVLTHFCLPQMKVFMFTFWCILINVLWKDWNIPVIWQLYDVTIASHINLIGVLTAAKNCRAFIGLIKSWNCLSIVNNLVIVTSSHVSAIQYDQNIEHTPMINCSKFHQVRIKTKKVMEGGGGGGDLDWETSKKLGMDRVNKRRTANGCYLQKKQKNLSDIYFFNWQVSIFVCLLIYRKKKRKTNEHFQDCALLSEDLKQWWTTARYWTQRQRTLDALSTGKLFV